jgi:uncharacterized membrane protein YdjX (TVP38/TMEM64 family)
MRRFRKLAAYAVAVAALAAAYSFLPISQEVVARELNVVAAYAHSEIFETLALFFLLSVVLAYFAFPAMPMVYLASGVCMDFWIGGTAVVLGSALGGLGSFLLFRDHIPTRHRLAPHHGSSWNMWLTLLGLRLSPVVPAPLVNVFAAISGVSPLQYLTTTMLGSAPLILFYAEIGRQGYLTASGEMPHWWTFSGCLVIFGLSTLMSLFGPWRSVLATVKQLKNEAVVSLKRSTTADWAPPDPAGRIVD